MNAEIVVAILGLVGTLVGSFLGILTSTKLTEWRIAKLEEKVDKHNQVIERVYKLETRVDDMGKDIMELKQRMEG